MQKPVNHLTLSAEDGEALSAQVHRSSLPRADAERVEWVIRMYFYVVFALQEAKLSIKRLRALLFGKHPPSALVPEAASTSSQGDGKGANASGGFEADPGRVAAPGPQAPVGTWQLPERAPPKGGHRPGTGRRGADAYTGATRAQCRHEELAVGQRCPGCGQGTLYPLPAGVEMRMDGNALLSALRYEVERLRCSACGEIFTAGVPAGVGTEK